MLKSRININIMKIKIFSPQCANPTPFDRGVSLCPAGTEPLIRIMVEGEDRQEANKANGTSRIN